MLQISGEHEFPLSPLELPPEDVTLVASMQYAGLRLFVERAMMASPNFSLDESSLPAVTAICKRLEGLPLAIELTASLCRAMTPQQILPKLQDRFKLLASARRDLDPRQRSLKGALDWSYDLLNEDERKLFSELSVFAGGFSLEALEEVCPISEALEYVFALRDKSLVRTLELGNEIRYSMLESIREYARERQREFEEDEPVRNESAPIAAIRSRHASYFLRLAQKHSPKLLSAGLELEEARKALELELANMRSGMQFNVEQRYEEEIVKYGIELSRFLQIRSLYAECEEVLNVAEAAARKIGNKSSLALLLNRHGLMASNRADSDQALRLFQESYDLGKEIDDKRKIMIASINLGNIAWGQSRFNDAEKIWSETLSLSIESGNANNQAMLLGSLGILATWRGEFERARTFFERSLGYCNQGGSSEQLAGSLFNYAELLARLGDYEGAKQKLKEAYSNYEYLGNEYGKLHVDILEGIVLFKENSLEEAKRILQKALTDSTKLGTPRTEMYASLALARVFAKLDSVEKARSLFLKSYEIGMTISDRKHLSDVMIYAAEMHKKAGNPTASFALQARADEEYREMGLKNDVFSQETLKNISQMIETGVSRPLSSNESIERNSRIMKLI